MSKKEREFSVVINELEDRKIELLINDKIIGFIVEDNDIFIAKNKDNEILGSSSKNDVAVSMIISDFNLNN
jgi:hypothetical protein